jgi:hypothetical protein
LLFKVKHRFDDISKIEKAFDIEMFKQSIKLGEKAKPKEISL